MLLNLTVVYLAFGAPLGVYGVIRSKGTSSREFITNLLRFVLWPLFAAVSVRKAFAFQPPASKEDAIAILRAAFEAEVEDVNEFRDVFARYTGLVLADYNSQRPANELLKIAGRKDPRLGAVCLQRRSRRRLEFHRLLARNEFLAFTANYNNNRVSELTSRLAALLSDADLH